MATVSSIEISFKACRGGESCDAGEASFDAVDSSLQTVVDDHFDDLIDELDGDDWEKNGYEIADYDSDWADPTDFSDLDDYGEYCEYVEKYGEAFHLRREDYGDINNRDFEDHYNGCWDSAEEFVRNMLEDCGDIPDHLSSYIDWEKYTRDVMMDYSEYDGCEGTHIFRA